MALSLFVNGRRSNFFDPFSLDIRDPFEGFGTLANIPSSARETTAIANTRIDWKETPEAHIFKADLPGIKKEEVKVEVEDGRVLQISGERSREQEEKNDKWHRVERSSGKFMRRFRLPENAKIDQVKASMENGVLTVTVPKEEEKKPALQTVPFRPVPRSKCYQKVTKGTFENCRTFCSSRRNLLCHPIYIQLTPQPSSSDRIIQSNLSKNLLLKSFEFTPSKNPTQTHHLMALSLFGGRRSNVFDPFSLDIWDPFEGFGDLANIPSSARETTAIANTRIDWKETPKAHIFKVDLPGIKKEEVKVEVEDGRVLQISGERSREQEEKNDKWHRVERSSGKFMRRFRLPENAKIDQVKAAMENGVLTVTVPKEEEKKPEILSIFTPAIAIRNQLLSCDLRRLQRSIRQRRKLEMTWIVCPFTLVSSCAFLFV
ncbi:hypothetical protein DVH24_023013 [Malus domestica]|uniref:SHSP domain-containing protein n=1 Tax=Malus domestica TaxID=3750 RepID=A0A498KL33_MALDO|nr:hypothetical protein DVH24_023013 [Malus domestica]